MWKGAKSNTRAGLRDYINGRIEWALCTVKAGMPTQDVRPLMEINRGLVFEFVWLDEAKWGCRLSGTMAWQGIGSTPYEAMFLAIENRLTDLEKPKIILPGAADVIVADKSKVRL